MKERLRKTGIVALWIVGIVLFLILIGFFRNMVNPGRVDRIELKTYDHSSYGQMELTGAEKWMLIAMYNLSREAGEIYAEPCCDAYGFYMYFDDGSNLYVGEGTGSKMILTPISGERFYLQNWVMDKYIRLLAEKYDLPIA